MALHLLTIIERHEEFLLVDSKNRNEIGSTVLVSNISSTVQYKNPLLGFCQIMKWHNIKDHIYCIVVSSNACY